MLNGHQLNYAQMKVTFARKMKKNRIVPMFGVKNITIDLCKSLSGLVHSNFLSLIIDDLKELSNCVHECPFTVWPSKLSTVNSEIFDWLVQLLSGLLLFAWLLVGRNNEFISGIKWRLFFSNDYLQHGRWTREMVCQI